MNKLICRLVSPYHYKSKIKLTSKESKIYKRRWKVETLFKVLKDNYSENKLNLTGKYTNKFFNDEAGINNFLSKIMGEAYILWQQMHLEQQLPQKNTHHKKPKI